MSVIRVDDPSLSGVMLLAISTNRDASRKACKAWAEICQPRGLVAVASACLVVGVATEAIGATAVCEGGEAGGS